MKKRILTIVAVVLMACGPAMSQVFMMEDAANNRRGERNLPGFIDNPGGHGTGQDWFVPVDGGVLLLAGLAGAYLFGKRRKED